MEAKKPRLRSPSSPVIDLEQALGRAGALVAALGDSEFNEKQAAEVWSMGPKSSWYLQTLSALRQFGLLEKNEAGGKGGAFIVSPLGKRLVRRTDGEIDFAKLLVEIALRPPVHKQLFELYANAPRPSGSGSAISFLMEQYRSAVGGGFSEDAARAAYHVYDKTMKFAKSHRNVPEALREKAQTLRLSHALEKTDFSESFLDPNGSRIVIYLETGPSLETYRFVKEFAEFKIAQLSKKAES